MWRNRAFTIKATLQWLCAIGVFGLCVVALTLINQVCAAEIDYAKAWCHQHKGQLEYVLPDRTRVDCLTATHAVEVDFAAKWYQALGQALHYSAMTGLRPGVVLIVQGEADNRYVARLQYVISEFKLPLDLWLMERKADAQN